MFIWIVLVYFILLFFCMALVKGSSNDYERQIDDQAQLEDIKKFRIKKLGQKRHKDK